MPQIDKVTFLPIVVWTALIYLSGYLFLNVTYFFSFFSGLKLLLKRLSSTYTLAMLRQKVSSTVLFFSWITL